VTSHDNESRDNAEFDLFLKRKGELALRLQSLEQLVPSAKLDAAILAAAEGAIAKDARRSRDASNDPIVPGAARVRLSFFRGWQMPMGLAASVVVAVFVALQWQGQTGAEASLQIAQAPQIQEPVTASIAEPAAPTTREGSRASSDTAPASAKTINRERNIKNRLEPSSAPSVATPVVIVQADIPQDEERILRSPAPAAAQTSTLIPAATPPHRDNQIEAGAKHPPKPWLALIEELLKADLRRDALDEWKQFQKSYPRYPVPEKLKKELDRPADK
jgi:hypothetical protein